jgi:lysophospholipase II
VHSGIDSRNIVLVGFSQGAALSLMVGLTTLHELGGIVSLSGWIPFRIRDVSQESTLSYHNNADIVPKQMIHTGLYLPILWCHGMNDNEIPHHYGEDAIFFMQHTLDIPEQHLTYKRYEGMAHAINDAELNDLALWLIQTLGSS